METHGASSNFGKDLGLIHEVVVTGRKVDADAGFWAALAHDPELFHRLVGVYKGTYQIEPITLDPGQYASVSEWEKTWAEVLPKGSEHVHEETDPYAEMIMSALGRLDLSRILLRDVGSYRQLSTTPRQRIKYLREMKIMCLGAREFITLWRNKDKIPKCWQEYREDPVEWRRKDTGQMWICFDGTVFKVPHLVGPTLYKQCVVGIRYSHAEGWMHRLFPLSEEGPAHYLSASYV